RSRKQNISQPLKRHQPTFLAHEFSRPKIGIPHQVVPTDNSRYGRRKEQEAAGNTEMLQAELNDQGADNTTSVYLEGFANGISNWTKPTLSLQDGWLTERTKRLLIQCVFRLEMVFPVSVNMRVQRW